MEGFSPSGVSGSYKTLSDEGSLIEGLKEKCEGLLLATATPLQLRIEELYDLLSMREDQTSSILLSCVDGQLGMELDWATGSMDGA